MYIYIYIARKNLNPGATTNNVIQKPGPRK